jgi:hypothetical protein
MSSKSSCTRRNRVGALQSPPSFVTARQSRGSPRPLIAAHELRARHAAWRPPCVLSARLSTGSVAPTSEIAWPFSLRHPPQGRGSLPGCPQAADLPATRGPRVKGRRSRVRRTAQRP